MFISILITLALLIIVQAKIHPTHHHASSATTSWSELHEEHLEALMAVLSTPEVLEATKSENALGDVQKMLSRTGVIYATDRAKKFGFKGAGDPGWGNLGQGAPETGEIPGQPYRNVTLSPDAEACEYSDVNGRGELRDAVAAYYNRNFRSGKESQYTRDNVAIVAGGRSGLSRLMASLHNINIGFFIPDYTAYTQLLSEFEGLSPIPLTHDDKNNLQTSASAFRNQIQTHGLGAFIFSNPANPTGNIVAGNLLKQYVVISRDENCLTICDEFYSHYIYDKSLMSPTAGFPTFSAAEFVDDVNKDPIIIVNGYTKNWRLPGWRVCWVVGPKHSIEILSSIGSYMDGGTNNPLQEVGIKFLDPDFIKKDARALQSHFKQKRDFMVKELKKLGIKVHHVPEATFYIWADVSDLPPPLNNGVVFFEYCIRHKVIVVPGVFFDVNPFHRRKYKKSLWQNYLRMSYGPAWPNLKTAVEGMKTIIELANQDQLMPLDSYEPEPAE